jgi:hypothetical protein
MKAQTPSKPAARMARSFWAADHSRRGVGQPIIDQVVAHKTSWGGGDLAFMDEMKKHENGY